jgi:release factor glutamine methyltransferase
MGTIAAQLAYATNQLTPIAGELAGLEARLLAQHAWGVEPEVIVRDLHAPLDTDKIAALDALLARRVTRQPIAQILGYKYFWNDRFTVTRDVLTPRADSETIIESVLRLRPVKHAALHMLDLGTGSGCLLLSLLGEYQNASGIGVDLSPAALLVAMENAKTLGRDTRSEFISGNWCETLEMIARFDIVVANPPYIPRREMARLMADVRDHEPRMALDGGSDGLDAYRAILAQALQHMNPDGLLLFEVGQHQAGDVAAHTTAHGYQLVEIVQDLSGIDRVVVLQLNHQRGEDL